MSEIEQHKIISALKDLAIELQRTPSSKEFVVKTKISEYAVTKHFGTYTALRLAAGLDQYKQEKLSNAIFETPIEKHLDEYKPIERPPREPYPTMAIISDIHWPFHSQRVVDRFYKWVSDHKPSIVILNGDGWDMYSHAKFPRSHNVFTPKAEEEKSKVLNTEFWQVLKRASPKSRLIQMLGNHDVRPIKRTLEEAPVLEHWIERYMRELFTFDGVETVFDPRQELMIGDVMVHHGHKSQLGAHRDHALYNAIVGHTHKAGVVFREIRGQTLWEMNCGYAGDPLAKGLTYTPQKITNWTPGFGAVDEDGPRVIIC